MLSLIPLGAFPPLRELFFQPIDDPENSVL
jgi:hypothetical protein